MSDFPTPPLDQVSNRKINELAVPCASAKITNFYAQQSVECYVKLKDTKQKLSMASATKTSDKIRLSVSGLLS